MFLLVFLLLGTLGLFFVSRRAFRNLNGHGFYRFFAWETLLVLAGITLPRWFQAPFSWHQIVSWILLIVSALLVVEGVRLLHSQGKRTQDRADGSLFDFEKTSTLVTTGLYRYIRHPLYSSLLFLSWGIFFKRPSWLGGALALFCAGFLFATARTEERENLVYFGDEYRAYMRRTKMFIPFLL